MFQVPSDLFQFAGLGVSIVGQVGQFGGIWFRRIRCSWRIAFGDETDVLGLTPFHYHPSSVPVPWNQSREDQETMQCEEGGADHQHQP
jgi:hypothetical protein